MTQTSAETAKAAQKKPRTAPKEARRQQLIDATISSIAKHGISGTTMTTVTGIAGLSIGLVNFHFATKDNLFAETLRYLGEEHRAQWKTSFEKAELEPQAKLLAIVDAHFHPKTCNRKKLAVWFGFYAEAASRAKYRAIMQEIDPERWDVSIELIEALIADGGYPDLRAEDVAHTLEGLYDGLCLNILMYPTEFTSHNAKRNIRAYLAATFPKHFDIPLPN